MNSLDEEEAALSASYDSGEWLPTESLAEIRAHYKAIAKDSLKKDKRVNIRISERDLTELQRKAVHLGLPYQTLVSSILHQYINGNLREVR